MNKANVLLNYYNFDGDWTEGKLKKYICGSHPLVIPLAYRDFQCFDEASWQAVYGKNGEKYEKILRPFLSYGLKEDDVKWLDYFDGAENAKALIAQADLLFFTGGMPEKAILHMQELGITHLVQNFNGVVMGASAGAMLQLERYHITPDEDYASYGLWQGLGMVKGLDLEVHYLATELQNQCARRATQDECLPVYAIYHEGGLIVEGETVEKMGNVVVFEK